MLTPEEIADLRAKAQAATPGPWSFDPVGNVLSTADGQPSYITGEGDAIRKSTDLAYITAANPQAILQLLDMVERLKNDAMPRKVKDCEERAKGFDDCMTLIFESFKGHSEETCLPAVARGIYGALAHRIAKERDKSLEEYKAFLAEDS